MNFELSDQPLASIPGECGWAFLLLNGQLCHELSDVVVFLGAVDGGLHSFDVGRGGDAVGQGGELARDFGVGERVARVALGVVELFFELPSIGRPNENTNPLQFGKDRLGKSAC